MLAAVASGHQNNDPMKKQLRLFTLSTTLLLSVLLKAQPTDLFISEYVEGSSFNKALELYNGTSAAVDLGAGQYVLEVYFNGASSSTSLALTGTINPGSAFVLAHPSATLGVTPNVTTTVVNFNGNDAVVLRKASTILDVIGQVGFNPGTQWGSNDTSTLDRTLRRKIAICQGDPTSSNVFYSSLEWDGFPQNTFGDLGMHTVSCGPPPGGLSILPASLSFTTIANIASQAQSYAVTGNSLTAPVTITATALFELSFSSGGPFTNTLSIPTISVNPGTVNVFVRYNPTASGTNTGLALHSSTPFGATLTLSGLATTLTPIGQIQGTGNASSYTNQVVATSGVVVGDFQGANELGGFFIQDPTGDGNPSTSEGLFVSNTSNAVNIGDLVTITGTVEEYFNRTQLKSVTALAVQSTGNTVTPTPVSLPVSSLNDFEKLEGMCVSFSQTLTVSEVYALARYGEVALSANGRLYNPTNFVDPNDAPATGTNSSGNSNVAAVTAQQNLNDLSRILLDDKSNVQNPPTVPYVDAVHSTLRCGSTLSSLQGIMDFAFSVYRIQPVIAPNFNYAPRPAVPSVGIHNVKVASFNVLNYFNGNGTGGGFPTSRGASTAIEFTRQRNKIIEAIRQINADVLGLMEMENDGNGAQSAIADLVSGLNTVLGAGTYTFVEDPSTANGGTGTDEIKVALIYKPSVLSCVGLSKADNSSVHNRPPLAQTFALNSNAEKFSVVVNHFKSKGCSGATGNNADQGDGQSCFNDSRKQQAAALLTFISSIQTQANDNDLIAIGDFNAYEQEDPIDRLLAGGLVHLLDSNYSYVYMGQTGSLDHAFVSSSIANQVSGADKWHINCDEPVAKDYNQEFNPAYMYSADAFRSSDHDPVMIGMNLQTITTGILSNTSANVSLSVFPNPTEKELKVSFTSIENDTIALELIDEIGRSVYSQTSHVSRGKNNLSVTLPALNPGMYYLVLDSQGVKTTKKVMIVK